MSRHVADAAGTGFLSSWGFVRRGVTRDLPSLLPSISTAIKSTTKTTWWRCVLIGPLKEATLLVSGLPAGVEHPSLVRAVFLHRAHHCRLITVAHRLAWMFPHAPLLPYACCRGVPETQRWPRGLWVLRCPLLTWLVRPQKEVAAASAALVELATLIGTVFSHGQEERILTAVAHDDITVGVCNDTAATWRRWRSRLCSPGGFSRKGRSGI